MRIRTGISLQTIVVWLEAPTEFGGAKLKANYR